MSKEYKLEDYSIPATLAKYPPGTRHKILTFVHRFKAFDGLDDLVKADPDLDKFIRAKLKENNF